MGAKPIVLVGLPGSGKSTVGRLLAERLGRRFCDLDELIEEEAGRPVPQIFDEEGEAGFRARETAALRKLLAADDGPVVAGGGGLVVTPENRSLLLAGPVVVWLDVPVDVLLSSRLEGGAGRPLLAGDARQRLEQLHSERVLLYRLCADVVIDDGGERQPEDVAAAILDAVGRGADQPILTEWVELGDGRSYPVLIGPGAVHQLPSLVPERAARAAVITQDGIDVEIDPGIEHRRFVVEQGEGAKRLDVVGQLASDFARWGLTRRDVVISVGGGVVSDLGGFVAATYHRGLPVVHVSTTLLGQIDAAIGGKCGVNLPEGKNLVGAFKQPVGVVCDTVPLATLPIEELRSGMGELAKYHFLGGSHLDRLPLAERVAACVRIKADVVAADETESGLRAILNYGHTLGHALEASAGYRARHGEAVAVGLVYAAEVARALGRISAERVEEHRRVVASYGLPTVVPPDLDHDELVDAFSRDKKALDGVTFVLDGPDGVEPVPVDDRDLLLRCLQTMGADG